jgi:uncharacterized membrane protein YbhN (UPF0104 family)
LSAVSPQPAGGVGLPLRRLAWIIPLGIVGNLAYTLLATDREALLSTVQLEFDWLVVALGLAMAPLALNAVRVWRWGRLLRPGLPFAVALRTVLLAEVGAAVTPSAVGGAPLKIASLARQGLGAAGGVAMTAVGSLEDLVAVLIVVPAAALASGMLPRFAAMLRRFADGAWPGHGFHVLAVVAMLAAAAIWLVLRGRRGRRRRERLRRWWRDTVGHLRLVRDRGLPTFVGNVFLACLQWTSRLSIVAALVAGLGVTLDPLRTMVQQWICFTGMTLTPTPGAVGGAEAAFLLVFGGDLPAPLTPLALAAWRLVTFYGITLVALGLLGLDSALARGRRVSTECSCAGSSR